MIKILSIFLCVLCLNLFAQNKLQESPGYLNGLIPAEVPTLSYDIISNQAIKNSNRLNNLIPAGKIINSNINLKQNCRLDSLSEYDGVYRIGIKSDSAAFIDLVLDSLFLGDEDEVWFYNRNQTQIYGPYNRFSINYMNNRLYSPSIQGEEIIVEMFNNLNSNLQTSITSITHLISSNFSSAANCIQNVKCPEATNWQDEARSVVKIRMANSSAVYWGSGVMINWVYGSNSNYKPYLLTAFHNLDFDDNNILNSDELELNDYQFYFGFDPSVCDDDDTWIPNDRFIAGASIKSANPIQDIALLQLNSRPSSLWNVYLAGFSTLPDLPESGVCIHSPACDDEMNVSVPENTRLRNKKISFSSNSTGNDVFEDWTAPNTGQYLIVKFIETSLPQGSSGSPLFNQDKQVCGILKSGTTNCFTFSIAGKTYGPLQPSYFGRLSSDFNFEYDFDNNGTAEKLSSFLAPGVISFSNITGVNLNTIICANGLLDGGENGIDCGGGCPNLCPANGGNSNLPHCTNCNATKTYHGRNFASNSTRRVRDNIVFTHRFAECNLNNDTQIGSGSNIFKAGQNIDFDCVDIIEESDFRIEACEIHLFNCLLGFMDERHGNFDIEEIEFPIQPKETIDENGKITTKKFELIPNPNNGEFTLNYYENSQNKKISIYNSLSQLIYFNENKPNLSYVNIDLKHLNSGVYFCQIVIENEVHKTKLVIQK